MTALLGWLRDSLLAMFGGIEPRRACVHCGWRTRNVERMAAHLYVDHAGDRA